MHLGVNFVHHERQAIGFDADAVRGLRPPIVRVVVQDPANLPAWIEAARRAHLSILWCFPVEIMGTVGHARAAVRMVVHDGLDVTAGIEIGAQPWAYRLTAQQFAVAALNLAEIPAWRTEVEVLRSRSRVFTFSAATRPLLLGIGFDGSREAWRWLNEFFFMARRLPALAKTFHGIGASATTVGRPFRRLTLTAAAHQVMGELGLPFAFTRVGWHTGQPMGWWRRFLENARAAAEAMGDPRREHLREVTPCIRRRWLLEAYRHAESMQATHFLLEPELPLAPGANRWSLYDPISQRTDRAWQTLMWANARAQAGPEAA